MTIHLLDLHYLDTPGAIAAYLVKTPQTCALIECGPASTLDCLIEALNERGVSPRDVRHVIVTHIHLDHAGSAGWWARSGARVHVHEFGAPHLVDPAKLINSATRIYGNDMDRLWGEILPAPTDSVKPIADGDWIDIGGLTFRAIETPGHARHHHAYAAEIDGRNVCFTGDAAAMIVPDSEYISIPSPPPEFDLEAWLASIDRLDAEGFDRLYLTHFGVIDEPADHFARLRPWLIEQADFVRDRMRSGRHRNEILAEYSHWMRQTAGRAGVDDRGLRAFLTGNLLAMSVDGMMRYWTKMQGERGGK